MALDKIFTDVHRTFIQTMSYVGTLEKSRAVNLFEDIKDKCNLPLNLKKFPEFLEEVNKGLAHFDQKIVTVDYDVNDNEYVVFYSTVESSLQQDHIEYNKNEVAFFHNIMSVMSTTVGHSASEIEISALGQSTKYKHIPMVRAEELLRTWCTLGYFYSHNDLIYLGPRSVMEFGGKLLNAHNKTMLKCSLCKGMVIKSVDCSGCAKPFHGKCIRKFLEKKKQCPECKVNWTETTLS